MTCGEGGKQKRYREIIVNAMNGGDACPDEKVPGDNSLVRERPCAGSVYPCPVGKSYSSHCTVS